MILGWWANNLFFGARSIIPDVGDGHVESHLTSKTVRFKGLEPPSQQDTLPWWIWENPIGFMTTVNNHQNENQSTVIEALVTIAK